jgi:hypothetical protein
MPNPDALIAALWPNEEEREYFRRDQEAAVTTGAGPGRANRPGPHPP